MTAAIFPVRIVQGNHRCLCDDVMPTSSMSINKILLILNMLLKEKRHLSKRIPQGMVRNTHGRHVSETEDQTDSIEDV